MSNLSVFSDKTVSYPFRYYPIVVSTDVCPDQSFGCVLISPTLRHYSRKMGAKGREAKLNGLMEILFL